MGLITLRGNDALTINPPAGDQQLVVNGSDWLWTVTAIYLVLFLVNVTVGGLRPRNGERIFHYIFSVALLVGTISYFAMASDLGWVVVATAENTDTAASYQIFWAKYVNWVVSWPALVVALGLLSGLSWATIFFGVALAWTWVVTYLVAAFTPTTYKWGFFAFGTVAWLLLAAVTLSDGLRAARRVSISRDYAMLAGWLNLIWLLYPIAFGVSDGGNKIGVTAAFIFFGILDLLTVPALSIAFLVLSQSWDYGSLNLHFTQYGRVAHGGAYPEKAGASAGAGGVMDPAV